MAFGTYHIGGIRSVLLSYWVCVLIILGQCSYNSRSVLLAYWGYQVSALIILGASGQCSYHIGGIMSVLLSHWWHQVSALVKLGASGQCSYHIRSVLLSH